MSCENGLGLFLGKSGFYSFLEKEGFGDSPRFLNKKRSRSEDLAFLFKIWDVGLHILILPDKKGSKIKKEHKGN